MGYFNLKKKQQQKKKKLRKKDKTINMVKIKPLYPKIFVLLQKITQKYIPTWIIQKGWWKK